MTKPVISSVSPLAQARKHINILTGKILKATDPDDLRLQVQNLFAVAEKALAPMSGPTQRRLHIEAADTRGAHLNVRIDIDTDDYLSKEELDQLQDAAADITMQTLATRLPFISVPLNEVVVRKDVRNAKT